jgi:hypothetical protein
VANLSTVSLALLSDGSAAGDAEQRHLAELVRMTRTALFVR